MADSERGRRVRPGGLYGWRSAELAGARRRAGLTQSELARQLRVSHSTVWSWENGQTPSVTVLPALCAGLGVDLQVLADIPVIRAARLAVGLSVPELARRAGLPVTAVRQLDSGSIPESDVTIAMTNPQGSGSSPDRDRVLRILEDEEQRLALPRFTPTVSDRRVD